MTKLLPLLRDVGAADTVQVKSPQLHGVRGVCVCTRAHLQLTGFCSHVTPEPCAQGHSSSYPNYISWKIRVRQFEDRQHRTQKGGGPNGGKESTLSHRSPGQCGPQGGRGWPATLPHCSAHSLRGGFWT